MSWKDIIKGKGERHFYIENGKPVQWTGETHKHPDGTLMSGKEHKEGVSKELFHFYDLEEKHLKHLSKETTVIKWEEVVKNIIRNKLGLGKKYFIDDNTYSSYRRSLDYLRGRIGNIEDFTKALFERWKNNGKQKLTEKEVYEVQNSLQRGTYRPKQPMRISGGGVMGGNDYGF